MPNSDTIVTIHNSSVKVELSTVIVEFYFLEVE